MGVKLCCSDTRDKNPEPEMKRFETFGSTDIPSVPHVLDRIEDREIKVDINESNAFNNDKTDNIYKRKKEIKSSKS
jgi:hypothetical protein